MQWAVLGLVLFGLILTYVIFQETRAHHYWRGLVQRGDISAIRALLEQEITRWRTMRVPKGTPPALWHGVQTTDLVAVGPDAAQLACTAEGEFRHVGGRAEEVTSAIDAAVALAAALVERVMFDVPNLRLSLVRVDVYSTFRMETGVPEQRCILSVTADRAEADDMEWEALRPAEIVGRFEHRYHVDPRGVAAPFEPDPPLDGTTPVLDIPAPPDPDEGRYVRQGERAATGPNAESPFE
jgi:hypothetical protein